MSHPVDNLGVIVLRLGNKRGTGDKASVTYKLTMETFDYDRKLNRECIFRLIQSA